MIETHESGDAEVMNAVLMACVDDEYAARQDAELRAHQIDDELALA